MKKFVITTAALLVFAGSTLSVSAAKPKSGSTQSSQTGPTQPSQTDVVASCPPNDPNACHMYDK